VPTINIPQEQENSPKKRGWGTFLFGSLDSPSNNSRDFYNNVRNRPIGSAFPLTNTAFPLKNNFNNTRRRNNKPFHAPPPPKNNTKRNRTIMVPRNPPAYPFPPRPYRAPPLPQTGLEYLNNLNKPKKPEPPLYAINNTRKKTRYPPRGYAPRMTRNNQPGINWEYYYPQETNPNTY
jgi:hypothetical protein